MPQTVTLDPEKELNAVKTVAKLYALNSALQLKWPRRQDNAAIKIPYNIAQATVDNIMAYQLIDFHKLYATDTGFVQFSKRPSGLVPDSVLARIFQEDTDGTLVINKKYVAVVDRDPIVVKRETDLLRVLFKDDIGFLDAVLDNRDIQVSKTENHKKAVKQSAIAKAFAKLGLAIPYFGSTGAEVSAEVKTTITDTNSYSTTELVGVSLNPLDRKVLRFSGTMHYLEDLINAGRGINNAKISIMASISNSNKLYSALVNCANNTDKVKVLQDSSVISSFADSLVCRDILKAVMTDLSEYGRKKSFNAMCKSGVADHDTKVFWNSIHNFIFSGRPLSEMEIRYFQDKKNDPILNLLAYFAEVYSAVSESVTKVEDEAQNLPLLKEATYWRKTDPELLYNPALLNLGSLGPQIFLNNPYEFGLSGSAVRGEYLPLGTLALLFPELANHLDPKSTDSILSFVVSVQTVIRSQGMPLQIDLADDLSTKEAISAYYTGTNGESYPLKVNGCADTSTQGITTVPYQSELVYTDTDMVRKDINHPPVTSTTSSAKLRIH